MINWITATFVLAGALWWIGSDNETAMRTCQERHSFDTCHCALHR